jgi:ATP-dependent protease ClpP protease subunit
MKVTSISTKEPSCSYPKLSASDVILKAEELRNTKQTLEEVLSRLTGKPLAKTSEILMDDW